MNEASPATGDTVSISLFQLGRFRLASGVASAWKIECDALTTEDWRTLAVIAVQRFGLRFGCVHGVPRGGVPFADALRPYAVYPGPTLVVDDVLTTGRSLFAERDRQGSPDALLLVAFARGSVPVMLM